MYYTNVHAGGYIRLTGIYRLLIVILIMGTIPCRQSVYKHWQLVTGCGSVVRVYVVG